MTLMMGTAMRIEQQCGHAGALIPIAASYALETNWDQYNETLEECRDRLERILHEISDYIRHP